MKIGEFARQSQVSPKMLRHDDAIGLFSPDTILNIKKNMPNMDMLYERAQALVSSVLEGTTFGIIRIDLRQFKAVNDIDGYDVGDKVIVGLYQTLENTLSQYPLQSSIARAGGDEFLVYLQGDHNLIREMSHSFKTAMKAFDYKAIGCHKPIDMYMGVVLSNTSPQTHLRKLMDDTYDAMKEAHHQIARGEEGIHIVEC